MGDHLNEQATMRRCRRSPIRPVQIGLVGLPGKHGSIGGDHVMLTRIAISARR